MRHDVNIHFARLFLWLFWTTLLLMNISWKSSWVAQKGDQVVKSVKCCKMTSTNDVIRQKRDTVWNFSFLKYWFGLAEHLNCWSIFNKKTFQSAQNSKYVSKVAFPCISYTKPPCKGLFTLKSLQSSVPTVYRP